MSIQKVTQPELSVRSYIAKLGINPSDVFYQSINSRNISTGNAQWTVTSPNKRANLLAWAPVDWQPRLTKRDQNNANDHPFGRSVNHISFKPCLPFANAMSSITVSLNGSSHTLSQPRRFMEQLVAANVTRAEAEVCYESGYVHDLGGQVNVADPGKTSKNVKNDMGLLKNEASFNNKIFKVTETPGYDENTNNVIVSYQEPLIVPPFNPFLKMKKDMPDYMWFKHMSDVIPNVDRLEIDIQFQKLSESVLFPRYMQAVDGANPIVPDQQFKNIIISDLNANLKLYWYEYPVNMSIPPQIDLQTWTVREFQSAITPVADGANMETIVSDLIQLNSVPTLIMITVKRDQDNTLYKSRAMSISDTLANPPVNPSIVNGGIHSWDSYAEIRNIQVLLGSRPNVISTNFTQRELYYLTQKNSKTPYPYDFTSWASKREARVDVNGVPINLNAQDDYGSKCCVLLRPKDLAEKLSDGVFAPNSLQINISATARDGFAGIPTGAAQTYRAYIHLFYGKHFLRIEPDKAQFQEQSIPLNEARRLTNPVLQQQGVSGLGGGLSSLRDRSSQSGVRSRIGPPL